MAIPKPLKRIEDFESLGLGMFVHWGLYSLLGMGEWTYHIHGRKMEDYEPLMNEFSVPNFDAEKLVLTAKSAGCKYITLTSRHHEGFSLYDTCGLSDFDAPHSAAGRDLIREFVDACNKHSIIPFFYHTTLDWHHADFNGDFDSYLEYLRKSVEILCKNYGKIGGLWFDGNWSKPGADWKEDDLYKTIRKYQPEAMIINNTGLSARGEIGNPEIDSVTFEQGRPTPMDREGMSKYVAAEMCATLNDHWGCGNNDLNYKSPSEIIETLCACRRVGANLLLNIGPKGDGSIGAMEGALMGTLGRWMDKFGEAIYLGRPHTSIAGYSKNFILKSDDSLYLFFHDLGHSGNENVTLDSGKKANSSFSGVFEEIESLEWMDNGEPLEFEKQGSSLFVNATGYHYGSSYCVRVAKAKIGK